MHALIAKFEQHDLPEDEIQILRDHLHLFDPSENQDEEDSAEEEPPQKGLKLKMAKQVISKSKGGKKKLR